jgi:NADP-dependent 3-hydroxy acid dehydrogenase YdfG
MDTGQKVAVITGASQGIGAALVNAYRDRNYRVVATARSIKSSDNDDVLTVPGDIADRKTAERAISAGIRADRYAGQQRRHLHRQAIHSVH